MTERDIAGMRIDFTGDPLVLAEMQPNPVDQFRVWFDVAADQGIAQPNAVTLATVGDDGFPQARVVLLKGLSDEGFVFYTNYESEKARACESAGRCALNFFWEPLSRQVRIHGTVDRVSAAESEAYFASRPRASQLGAWASPQSRVVADRPALEAAYAAVAARFEGGEVPRPPHWGGYRVRPEQMEFWQGHPGRMHDRIRYRRTASAWLRERLGP